VALQLTNILRDIREDLRIGRVYLPADELLRFGVALDFDAAGNIVGPPESFASLVTFSAERARDWYGIGLPLLKLLDRRSAACCAAMAGIYVRLLRRISSDPLSPMRSRASVPAWEKATVAARALVGAAA
jgi:phytoene synthase